MQQILVSPPHVRACQLAQYGQEKTWCTDSPDIKCRYALAMSVSVLVAAMSLLLPFLLLAASGALADESYETVHLAKGHNSLAAALSRPQKQASRALLVVGGRNDPEVPRFAHSNRSVLPCVVALLPGQPCYVQLLAMKHAHALALQIKCHETLR